MKTFTEYLDESNKESAGAVDQMIKKVTESWNSVMPDTLLSGAKSTFSGLQNHVLFRGFILKNKSEWINGIAENDPLKLLFSVDLKKDGSYVVEFNQKSLSITPDNKHLAYGRKSLSLRKTNAKDLSDLEKKLQKMFVGIRNSIKESLVKNEFSVYTEPVQEIIKRRFR